MIGALLSLACEFMVQRIIVLPVKITLPILGFAYILTLILSVCGSFFSVRKVNRIDPAIVFRG